MENLLPLSLLAIGLSLVAMELAVPGFYLAAIGAGAMASGLVGYLYSPDPLALFLSLSAVSAFAYLVLSSSCGYGLKRKSPPSGRPLPEKP